MNLFKLPDLGEGLAEADIVEWHVKEGDSVKLDQLLVSMETAKAVVEVPSPVSGKVLKLFGKAGDTILTGGSLVKFASDEKIRDTGTVAGVIEATDNILEENVVIAKPCKQYQGVKATPAVKALAKSLKVDLQKVKPSIGQIVTSNDVKLFAKKMVTANWDTKPGKTEVLKGVRKHMAETMARSNLEVAAVTVFDDAIVNWSDTEDITTRIIRAIAAGCKAEPRLNGWFDGHTLTYRAIETIDLGIAMDSQEGLFVPVIPDVATISQQELRTKIDFIKKQVKDRTIKPEALAGATITLSNFGRFAGKYANVMIVPPQVAILGVGALKSNGGGKTLPLSLTIDHRALTGGEATRFLKAVISDLA